MEDIVKTDTEHQEMDEILGFDRKDKRILRFMLIDEDVREILHPSMTGAKDAYDYADFKKDMRLIHSYLTEWLNKR